jgi:hypothetical protein
MPDTTTIHEQLNLIEGACADMTIARMLRLRMAIARIGPGPWSENGTTLETHWLTLVHEPTGDAARDTARRHQLRALLRGWLDEQTPSAETARSATIRSAASGSGHTARTPLPLQQPLRASRGDLRRWWEHFERINPQRHELGRELAAHGVYELHVSYLHATALVASRSGSPYLTVLRWSGGMPKVPHAVAPSCACLGRRRWCKHAIAVAYHLIERAWRSGTEKAAPDQQIEKPPESATKR